MRSIDWRVDEGGANAVLGLQRQPHSRRALIQLSLAAVAACIGGEPALAGRRKRHAPKSRVEVRVDQQHVPANTGSFGHGLSNAFTDTQTFTVGLAGKLARVSVLLEPLTSTPGTQHVIAEIFPVDSTGAPVTSGAPLASGRISTAAVPADPNQLVDIALSPQIAVEVDQILALALHADAPASYGWFGVCCSDPYPRGAAASVPGGDFYFQTFVAVAKATPHKSRRHRRRGR